MTITAKAFVATGLLRPGLSLFSRTETDVIRPYCGHPGTAPRDAMTRHRLAPQGTIGGMGHLERRPLLLYKRWKLRPGVRLEDVVALVRQQVLPAYRRLSGDVTLGLELALDGTSVVAIQRWASRETQEAVASADGYADWWADYQPSLAEWDRLLEFVSEWSTVDVDLRGGDLP